MAKGKTRKFKDRQCRYCELADLYKFKQGQPCCPITNPRIQNGHCLDRKPTTKSISKVRNFGVVSKGQLSV